MQAAQHILIVEDDLAVRRMLKAVLEEDGYNVVEAATIRDAVTALSRYSIDLVTLDLGLGRDNGLVLAQQIRAASHVPIVIVSGKGSDVDRIVGLELGADDYIAKPFNAREVLARIRAVLRRSTKLDMAPDTFGVRSGYEFDGWICDVASRRLARPDGQPVRLTTREFSVLETFLRRPQRVLSRQQILEYVSLGSDDVLDRAVDTVIGRLRRKLTPSTVTLIETVQGAGYMFTAKVKSIRIDADDASIAPSRGI